jgi:N4-gp56 family major capsid protein
MAITVLKPQQIVAAGLGLLERESTLPQLIWRDAVGDFAGALNDTISIRLPAYATARTRALRSGTTRTRDSLAESKVDVTLDTDIYKDVRITDEELTLDIATFGAQVLNPILNAHVQKMEDLVAAEMSGATYAKTLVHDISDAKPYADIAVAARKLLNNARVPTSGRSLVVGADIEAELLQDDKFIRSDYMGQAAAMREGQIGRVAGFEVFPSSAIEPSEAYAFHRTAFVMSQRAPVVPAGAPFGATQSYKGFALRVVRVLDSATIEDILATDSWIGLNTVTDDGYFDAAGRFWPREGAEGTAVTLANPSAAADDIIDTTAAHGFVAGDRVVFTALTGGAGLSTNREYFVIAANLAATTFQVSTTLGGSAVNFTTDITAGSVRKNGAPLLVRAVKITSQA